MKMSMFRKRSRRLFSPRFLRALSSIPISATATISARSRRRALVEALGTVRRRITKRCFAGYHFRDEPASRGAERQAPMRMSDGQPSPRHFRHAAKHRTGVGQARPAAHPGFVVDPFAERKKLARLRHDPVKLHGRGLSVTRGEFVTGRYADTLLHRRDQVTDVGVEHGTRKPRITLRAEMAVITPFDRERQRNAYLPEKIRRPRAAGDD